MCVPDESLGLEFHTFDVSLRGFRTVFSVKSARPRGEPLGPIKTSKRGEASSQPVFQTVGLIVERRQNEAFYFRTFKTI